MMIILICSFVICTVYYYFIGYGSTHFQCVHEVTSQLEFQVPLLALHDYAFFRVYADRC
jgi:hypothetical protein